jgi:hypothetical protein
VADAGGDRRRGWVENGDNGRPREMVAGWKGAVVANGKYLKSRAGRWLGEAAVEVAMVWRGSGNRRQHEGVGRTGWVLNGVTENRRKGRGEKERGRVAWHGGDGSTGKTESDFGDELGEDGRGVKGKEGW